MCCKNCGVQLVPGQIICSTCGTENYENINNSINVSNYEQSNRKNEIKDYYTDNINFPKEKLKQNFVLRIASILALIASIGMIIMVIGNLTINVSLNNFEILDLFKIIVPIIMLFDAFLISNFNLGKNKLFDSKIVFAVFLIINLLCGWVYRIYLLIFIFSLIGFIISIKNNNEKY